ncbi:hypothetical protein N7G274_005241 [Stereocaulon virgatum]|uniref:TAZ-type domain-containing protein n=1 Tax=Stereocaulon virgatum TaxID=373712 RepID=A0ABR4AF90_9LECA
MGRAGLASATTHHCPGRKISKYIKMGRCDKQGKMCATHQIYCRKNPNCIKELVFHLSGEPCPKCETRKEIAEAPAREARNRLYADSAQRRIDNKGQKGGKR